MRLMRDLVGTSLSARYHLLSRLAGGGMGEVYRAHDLLLDRPVAVKVLQPSLAADPLLVERFKDEARAAARLSHPNVVAVYDWGQEDENTYYMVMEYVAGSDLRDLLVARGSVDATQAVEIMASVCDALAEAHARGLVHRDVKPENVLIAREGKIKVADFGIAVVADADRTAPGSGVPGTMRYLSPEQAQGFEATFASDIWAAGAVLAELLTGQPPLLGAGTEILRRRATEEIAPPSAFDPSIPHELDDLVLRACALDPFDRYRTADDMGAALKRVSVRSLPDSEPIEDLLQDLTGEIDLTDLEPTSFRRRSQRRRGAANRLMRVALVVALLAVAALAGMRAVAALGDDRAVVPGLVGLGRARAIDKAEDVGLDVKVIGRDTSFSIPRGHVLAQDPDDGRLREGGTIEISISKGFPVKPVPDVTGMKPRAAATRLRAAGFTVSKTLERYSDAPKGTVFKQLPASGKHEWGTEVALVVSLGPEPVQVPDVVGLARADAEASLEDAGFEVAVIEVYSDSVPAGEVVAMSPEPGVMASRGSAVELQASIGPEFEEVTVPDVRGLSVERASAELEEVGLRAREVESCDTGKTVVETDPIAGATAHEQDLVALFTC